MESKEMGDFICLHSMSFSHSCIIYGAVEWSGDDRISIIQEQGIYILKLISRTDVVGAFKIEVAMVPNPSEPKKFDVDIDSDSFCLPPINFEASNSFVYDRMLNHNKALFNNTTSFSQAKWSPPGFLHDGRCILATLTINHHLNVHSMQEYIGKSRILFDLSEELYKYCRKDFFRKIDSKLSSVQSTSSIRLSKTFDIYRGRLHYLATAAICWCPCLIKSVSLQSDDAPTPPKKTMTTGAASNVRALLAATNKVGLIFIWVISNDWTSDSTDADILHVIDTGKAWADNISWHQVSPTKPGYLAVGYVDGCIDVFVFRVGNEAGKLNLQVIQTYNIWTEMDEILVNKCDWMIQKKSDKGKQMTLIVTKGTNILLFSITTGPDGQIQKHSFLLGPSLHQTQITSLSVRDSGYVASSGMDGLVQCFHIDDLSPRVIYTGCREGYSCFGVELSPESLMMISLHCPIKILLTQPRFLQQMDAVFMPLLPFSVVSQKFVRQETEINVEYREFFRAFVYQGIRLHKVLHELSDEQVSVATSSSFLQKVAFLKWLKEFEEIRAEKEKEKEEGNFGRVSPVMKNEAARDIEKILWQKLIENVLTKGMQSIQSRAALSQDDVTTLLLACDWTVSESNKQRELDLALKIYENFGHAQSVEKAIAVWKRRKNESGSQVPEMSPPSTPSSSKENPVAAVTTSDPSRSDSNDMSVVSAVQSGALESFKEISKEQNTTDGLLGFDNDMPCREHCPLCQNEVQFNRLDIGKCSKSHLWKRCSLTLRICPELRHRKCTVCLKRSKTKVYDDSSKSVLCDDLLNTDNCPFCNGRLIDPLT